MFGKDILKNMDGQKYYDRKKNVFLLDFDKEQRRVILLALDQGIDAGVFAYPYIPADDMNVIAYYMRENPKIKRVEFWKIGQSGMDCRRKELVCEMLQVGIKFLDQVEDVSMIPNDYVFEAVLLAKQYHKKNICKEVACDGVNDFKCGDIDDLNRKYNLDFSITYENEENNHYQEEPKQRYTEEYYDENPEDDSDYDQEEPEYTAEDDDFEIPDELDFPAPPNLREIIREERRQARLKREEEQRRIDWENEDLLVKCSFEEFANLKLDDDDDVDD